MGVVGNTATRGMKEIRSKWPVEKGLTAGTQKQTGRTQNLVAKGINGIKRTTIKSEDAGL